MGSTEYWLCNCGHQEPYTPPTKRQIVLYGGNGIPHTHTFVNKKGFTVEETTFMVHAIVEYPDPQADGA